MYRGGCYFRSFCPMIWISHCRLLLPTRDRIYKCCAVVGSDSLVIKPPTGSLLLAALVRHLAAEFRLCGLIECEDCFWIVVCRTLRFDRHWRVTCVMAADRDTPLGARSGVTFDVTIEIPWNAPEAHIQLNSADVFDLESSIQDIFGLCNRRPDAAGVRVTQGLDDRSVCVLVPDPWVLDNGFHDTTIIDMGDMAEPVVSEDDLSLLRRPWPVSVIQSMTWMQSELDDMRASAKKRFRHLWPGACTHCGKYITCDKYHHVSNYYLDLGQLWRCPVS